MGRPRHFTREEVLKKAIPVFWNRGYADTSLQDLEEATGVNKSGLYSEFESKEEIFLESLRYYLEHHGAVAVLSTEPLGWGNIERLARQMLECRTGPKGCFGINTMRETAILPAEAQRILAESKERMKQLIEQNVRAEKTKGEPRVIAGIVGTFFSGLYLEQNLKSERAGRHDEVGEFMRMVRGM
ncbi:MAG: TetR/AcrR family transcriptional regulator [Phycisphaerae bacterium]